MKCRVEHSAFVWVGQCEKVITFINPQDNFTEIDSMQLIVLLHKAAKYRLCSWRKSAWQDKCVSDWPVICLLYIFFVYYFLSQRKMIGWIFFKKRVSSGLRGSRSQIFPDRQHKGPDFVFPAPPPLIHSCTSCLTCPPSPVCSQHVGR